MTQQTILVMMGKSSLLNVIHNRSYSHLKKNVREREHLQVWVKLASHQKQMKLFVFFTSQLLDKAYEAAFYKYNRRSRTKNFHFYED